MIWSLEKRYMLPSCNDFPQVARAVQEMHGRNEFLSSSSHPVIIILQYTQKKIILSEQYLLLLGNMSLRCSTQPVNSDRNG